MRLAFLMTIPSSVGLIVLAEPIISVLYQHGRFGAFETAESAGALRFSVKSASKAATAGAASEQAPAVVNQAAPLSVM